MSEKKVSSAPQLYNLIIRPSLGYFNVLCNNTTLLVSVGTITEHCHNYLFITALIHGQ